MANLNQYRKTLKLRFENIYYRWRYAGEFDLEKYLFKSNLFSGKRLNILYLTYYDSTFSLNNTYLPLCELGSVYKFELNPTEQRGDWYQRKVQVNRDMLAFVRATVATHPIDVIVCYLSGFNTTPDVLTELRSFGIPMINEGLDDERKFVSRPGKDGIRRGMKDICRYFDLSLTTSRSAIIKYQVEGGNPMYKPYAGNPDVYKILGVDKLYDVAFVGANYGSRSTYINYLEQQGISVYAKGSGWPLGFASPDEMVEIFNRARIVLGFAGVGENDDICILKGRDFEVPLTGSLYLTQYHPELEEYFIPGQDLAVFHNKEDLLAKVQFYLAHEAERETIAKNGYRKCLENHTAKISYEKVFGYLGL